MVSFNFMIKYTSPLNFNIHLSYKIPLHSKKYAVGAFCMQSFLPRIFKLRLIFKSAENNNILIVETNQK
jgi:hypothetical protein